MKKIYTLIALAISSLGFSQVLLTDDFNYTGDLTANGWTAHSGAGTQAINTTTGLTFTGYAGSGIGNAANLDNNGEDVHKTFTSQTTGTVYVAFMLQTAATNSAGYFLNLGPNPIGTSFYPRLFVNATGDGLAISESTTPTTFPVAITAGTTTLVVIKRVIATGDTSLYVFNTLPTAEPTTAGQTITGTANNSIGAIALRQYNASQNQIVDGLRIANSWTDIFPAPAEFTVDATAITALDYIENNGPSASQSFEVSGDNLDGTDVIITAPTDFEVSLDDTTFTSTVTLTAFDGTATDVYVRLATGLALNTYTGDVEIDGGGITTPITINVSGEVTKDLSIKENNIEGLNIFPNPANDVLNITSNSAANKNVQLFDLTGKKVLDVTTVSQVNVSTLKAGIYVAKINEAGKTATRKVVIK